jgi:membrane protein
VRAHRRPPCQEIARPEEFIGWLVNEITRRPFSKFSGGQRVPRRPFSQISTQPWRFTLQVLKAFQKNQGLLLSGALAYYILLSIIPLFTLLLLILSHVIDEAALMTTLRRYIGLIIPGDSAAILAQVRNILEHREVAGWVVLAAMLFFSSMAFTVLESAMSIIFVHRVRHKPRSLVVSLLLPYIYIVLLGAGFLVMTVIASLLQSMSDDQLVLLGRGWSLDRLSLVLLYLTGVVGLILVLTSIYLVMPPRGRISLRHALAGGIVVGLLWEGTRHVILWYFSTLSVVGVVYGSLATTIIGLLSLEIASIFLLLGAQVIAEYERLEGGDARPAGELQTDAARVEVE